MRGRLRGDAGYAAGYAAGVVAGEASGADRAPTATTFGGAAGDRWSLPHRTAYRLPASTVRTIEYWLTIASAPSANMAVAQHGPPTIPPRWLTMIKTDRKAALWRQNADTSFSVILESTTGVATGSEQKVQFCRTAAGLWTVYQNGVADGTNTDNTAMNYTGPLWIGDDGNNTGLFTGTITRLAVYPLDLAGVAGLRSQASLFWGPTPT